MRTPTHVDTSNVGVRWIEMLGLTCHPVQLFKDMIGHPCFVLLLGAELAHDDGVKPAMSAA